MALVRVIERVVEPPDRGPLTVEKLVPLGPSHTTLADTGTSTTDESTLALHWRVEEVAMETKTLPGSRIETLGVGTGEWEHTRSVHYTLTHSL